MAHWDRPPKPKLYTSSSHPTGEVYISWGSAAGQSHTKHPQPNRSSLVRHSETSQYDSRPQYSSDPTGQNRLNPPAEGWNPQKSSTNNQMPKGLPPQAPPLSPLPGAWSSTPLTSHRLATRSQAPQAPRLPTLASPHSTVTNLFDTGDVDQQLNPPSADYKRYPLFPPPSSSSHPTGEVYVSGASAAGQSHTEYPQSKRSSRVRPSETSQYDSQLSQVSVYPTGQNRFNPEAEVWGQHMSSTDNQMPGDLPPPAPRLDPLPPPSLTATSLSTNMIPPTGRRSAAPYIAHNNMPGAPLTRTGLPAPPPSRPSQVSADPTEQKWFNPNAEVLGQQRSSTDNQMPRGLPPPAARWDPLPSPSLTATSLPTNMIPPIESLFSAPPTDRRSATPCIAPLVSFYPAQTRSSGYDPKESPAEVQLSAQSGRTITQGLDEEPVPAEWIYRLPLTLERLFKGGTYKVRVTTHLLSGDVKLAQVQIDVGPGCHAGTQFTFFDAGNERAPGVFQTMVFVVEQVHHERFERGERGKLVYNTVIDLMDAKNGRREVRKVVGLDGKIIEFHPPKGVINHGQEMVIKGEGMYRESRGSRGDLIIRWNIRSPDQVTPNQVHRMRDIFRR
ncbi:hypothetical protein FRC01_003925 [Tulasnella sp. 417]|nr:hypothetical protein FRC01_003925 [Tulasnella sp. 417]